jgi:hypothetical protein
MSVYRDFVSVSRSTFSLHASGRLQCSKMCCLITIFRCRCSRDGVSTSHMLDSSFSLPRSSIRRKCAGVQRRNKFSRLELDELCQCKRRLIYLLKISKDKMKYSRTTVRKKEVKTVEGIAHASCHLPYFLSKLRKYAQHDATVIPYSSTSQVLHECVPFTSWH